jgi:hypothetical protein
MAMIIRLTESDLNRIVRKVIKEQSVLGTLGNAMEIYGGIVSKLANILPPVALANLASSAINSDAKTFNQLLDQQRTKLGQEYTKLKNAVTKGDIAKNLQNIGSAMKPYADEFKSGIGNQPQARPAQAMTKSTPSSGGYKPKGPQPIQKTTAPANQQKKSPYVSGGGEGDF